jgi:hypothetical protein
MDIPKKAVTRTAVRLKDGYTKKGSYKDSCSCERWIYEKGSPTERQKTKHRMTKHRMTERRKTECRMTEHRMTEHRIGPNAK